MCRALTVLTALVYALALTAGLVLGDHPQRIAALLLTAVLLARFAVHRHQVAPVASPVAVVGGAS